MCWRVKLRPPYWDDCASSLQPFYTDPPSVTTLSNTSTVVRDVQDNLARARLGEVFDALRTSGINATVGYLEQHDLRAKLTVSISQAVSLLSGAALPIPPWLNAMIEAGYDTSQTLIQTGQLFGEVGFAIRHREVSRRNIIARMVLGNDPAIGRRPALFPGEDMVFAPGKEPEEVDGE
jgi:hypothetical protein